MLHGVISLHNCVKCREQVLIGHNIYAIRRRTGMIRQVREYSIIELNHFIQATRDSGYKGTASAIAELIDNAYEASATCVNIRLHDSENQQPPTVVISDNGTGMPPTVLRLALRFGGSTRFNSRKG